MNQSVRNLDTTLLPMLEATAFILLRWKRRANLIVTRPRMPKTPLTHHLVALWFADIAGYSDRAAEDERGALQLIEILQTLSRDTVRRYEGRVVKFMGDAVLAEFTSTELAVRAATALSEQY